MAKISFINPFRPGAGHMPPYLAGREKEKKEFSRFLDQTVILENVILTGLRGVGKTVLLDKFKPLAIAEGWLWVGADMSESVSISEDRLAIRLMTDLSVVTSSIVITWDQEPAVGFGRGVKRVRQVVDFEHLKRVYDGTPGMTADKVKAVLEHAWECLKEAGARGVVFAYDEAQNLSDNAAKDEYPLSVMLDVFQSIQRKGIPFLLVLTGLPTLFPKLVEARTYAERMFHVIFLDRLTDKDSRDAIHKPTEDTKCPVKMSDTLIAQMIEISVGYPYFIQFLGREVYDVVLQQIKTEERPASPRLQVQFTEIVRKLDNDFFMGRWSRATDRQRDLLHVVAELPNADKEFTVSEIVEGSKRGPGRPFSPSHASQLLGSLCDSGLVFKNRHGRYTFAVPLLDRFIKRIAPRPSEPHQ